MQYVLGTATATAMLTWWEDSFEEKQRDDTRQQRNQMKAQKPISAVWPQEQENNRVK
jgi:hypothetical protein